MVSLSSQIMQVCLILIQIQSHARDLEVFSQLVFLMLWSHCYSAVLLSLVDYIYQDVRCIKSE